MGRVGVPAQRQLGADRADLPGAACSHPRERAAGHVGGPVQDDAEHPPPGIGADAPERPLLVVARRRHRVGDRAERALGRVQRVVDGVGVRDVDLEPGVDPVACLQVEPGDEPSAGAGAPHRRPMPPRLP